MYISTVSSVYYVCIYSTFVCCQLRQVSAVGHKLHVVLNRQPFSKRAEARLAQSAERKALNLVVVGSSPTVGPIQRSVMASIELLHDADTYVDRMLGAGAVGGMQSV